VDEYYDYFCIRFRETMVTQVSEKFSKRINES